MSSTISRPFILPKPPGNVNLYIVDPRKWGQGKDNGISTITFTTCTNPPNSTSVVTIQQPQQRIQKCPPPKLDVTERVRKASLAAVAQRKRKLQVERHLDEEKKDKGLETFLTRQIKSRSGRVIKTITRTRDNGNLEIESEGVQADSSTKAPTQNVRRRDPPEMFRCQTCRKIFIGHTKLRHHFKTNPGHEPSEEYRATFLPPPRRNDQIPTLGHLAFPVENKKFVSIGVQAESPEALSGESLTNSPTDRFKNSEDRHFANCSPHSLGSPTDPDPVPAKSSNEVPTSLDHTNTTSTRDLENIDQYPSPSRQLSLLRQIVRNDPILNSMESMSQSTPVDPPDPVSVSDLCLPDVSSAGVPDDDSQSLSLFNMGGDFSVDSFGAYRLGETESLVNDNNTNERNQTNLFGAHFGHESNEARGRRPTSEFRFGLSPSTPLETTNEMLSTEDGKSTSSIPNLPSRKSLWDSLEDKVTQSGINQVLADLTDVSEKLSKIARDKIIPIREEEEERLNSTATPVIRVDNPFMSHLLDLPFGAYIFKEDGGVIIRPPPPPPSAELSLTGGVEVDIDRFLTPDIAKSGLPHLTNIDFGEICDS